MQQIAPGTKHSYHELKMESANVSRAMGYFRALPARLIRILAGNSDKK